MRKETGKKGEKYAADYLWTKGYEILRQNYYSRFGEVDIIAKHNDILVFVEVKTRKQDHFGQPEEAINRRKLRKLKRTIIQYLLEKKYYGDWRMDIIAIQMNSFDEVRDIRHYMNAQLF